MKEDDKWSRASLRIASYLLTSKQIALEMEMDPSYSHDVGDLVSKRNPEGPVRKYAICVFESILAVSEPLDLHIANIIDLVEAKRIVLQNLRKQCTIDLFCGYYTGNGQGGFVLEPELTRRMAQLNFDIIFDFHLPCNDVD